MGEKDPNSSLVDLMEHQHEESQKQAGKIIRLNFNYSSLSSSSEASTSKVNMMFSSNDNFPSLISSKDELKSFTSSHPNFHTTNPSSSSSSSSRNLSLQHNNNFITINNNGKNLHHHKTLVNNNNIYSNNDDVHHHHHQTNFTQIEDVESFPNENNSNKSGGAFHMRHHSSTLQQNLNLGTCSQHGIDGHSSFATAPNQPPPNNSHSAHPNSQSVNFFNFHTDSNNQHSNSNNNNNNNNNNNQRQSTSATCYGRGFFVDKTQPPVITAAIGRDLLALYNNNHGRFCEEEKSAWHCSTDEESDDEMKRRKKKCAQQQHQRAESCAELKVVSSLGVNRRDSSVTARCQDDVFESKYSAEKMSIKADSSSLETHQNEWKEGIVSSCNADAHCEASTNIAASVKSSSQHHQMNESSSVQPHSVEVDQYAPTTSSKTISLDLGLKNNKCEKKTAVGIAAGTSNVLSGKKKNTITHPIYASGKQKDTSDDFGLNPIALNATVFASVLLASRLENSTTVFAFTLLGLLLFVSNSLLTKDIAASIINNKNKKLLTIGKKINGENNDNLDVFTAHKPQQSRRGFYKGQKTYFIVFILHLVSFLSLKAASEFLSWLFVIIMPCIIFGGPLVFLRSQQNRFAIQGPWDTAHVDAVEMEE